VIRPWTQFYNKADRADMPLSECNDITITGIDVVSKNFFDVGASDKYKLRNFSFIDCKVKDQKKAFKSTLIENTVTKNLVIE
jgi:hypothetical protein